MWLVLPATALLLLPAIWNGFPLIFPDSGAYLLISWTDHWAADRSAYYGVFMRSLSIFPPITQVWLWLALQAAAIGATIIIVIRRVAPSADAPTMIVAFALLVLLTSLPWHAAQIMPDAFTGVCVLTVWLACTRAPTERGTPLLWLAAFLSGLVHFTHLILIIATGAATLVALGVFHKASRRALAERGAVCAAVAVLVLGTQTLGNGVFLKRWSPAPVGSAFFFARLHEDGVVQPWLRRHCTSGATPLLCRLGPSLPRDSQELLWRNDAAFLHLVFDTGAAGQSEHLSSELRTASLGSIAEQPLLFAEAAARGTAEQFFSFEVIDDECPTVCRDSSSSVYSALRYGRPGLLEPFLKSRQLRDTIGKRIIRSIITPMSTAGLLLLPVFGFFAWRRRDGLSFSLVVAVTVALVANAFAAGTLSDVHDRYQSRVVWLASLVAVLLMIRWRFRLSRSRRHQSKF